MEIRFEGFDRRIDKINAFLNSIGVKDLAEAKKMIGAGGDVKEYMPEGKYVADYEKFKAIIKA